MAKGKKVLVIGDANVDLLVRLPRTGPDGEKVFPEPQICGGGSAANTAFALAKLGLDVDFLGMVGEDSYGEMVDREMAAAGIGTEQLQRDAALHTVCVFAFIDEKGERSLWPWPREAQSFLYLDRDKINWRVLETADWLHASGMVFSGDTSARKVVIELLRRADELGLPASFDLNIRLENDGMNPGSREAILEAMRHCRYVLGSAEEEFACLRSGERAGDGLAEAESFATDKRIVIARQGAKGSTAFSAGGSCRAPAIPAQVADTVGAGDAYNAGFIAACLNGKTLEEALLWGNGAGSYAVSHNGGRNTATLRELLDTMA